MTLRNVLRLKETLSLELTVLQLQCNVSTTVAMRLDRLHSLYSVSGEGRPVRTARVEYQTFAH